jgi:hypothetical protein
MAVRNSGPAPAPRNFFQREIVSRTSRLGSERSAPASRTAIFGLAPADRVPAAKVTSDRYAVSRRAPPKGRLPRCTFSSAVTPCLNASASDPTSAGWLSGWLGEVIEQSRSRPRDTLEFPIGLQVRSQIFAAPPPPKSGGCTEVDGSLHRRRRDRHMLHVQSAIWP